jgi:hypothetical protein
MRSLKLWVLARFLPKAPNEADRLPFTSEEFLRLIRSRNPESMKLLARGLARPQRHSTRR